MKGRRGETEQKKNSKITSFFTKRSKPNERERYAKSEDDLISISSRSERTIISISSSSTGPILISSSKNLTDADASSSSSSVQVIRPPSSIIDLSRSPNPSPIVRAYHQPQTNGQGTSNLNSVDSRSDIPRDSRTKSAG